jgi:hypothetical protein
VCCRQWAAGELSEDALHQHVDDCLAGMAGF